MKVDAAVWPFEEDHPAELLPGLVADPVGRLSKKTLLNPVDSATAALRKIYLSGPATQLLSSARITRIRYSGLLGHPTLAQQRPQQESVE